MAKDIAYGIDARNALLAGIDKLADWIETETWKWIEG